MTNDKLGTNGKYYFKNIEIDAKGAVTDNSGKKSIDLYGDDLGRTRANGANFDISELAVENGTVTLDRQEYTSKAKFSGNTRFMTDVYTVKAYTKGSNGVTTDGVYFKFIGSKGETDWVHASIGNDKGEHTAEVIAPGVGTLTTIKVKTKSSNQWYPGKIEVVNTLSTGDYKSSSTLTVYGGRWIGDTEKTLSPDDNIYQVTINTSTSENAGTDAEIYLYLSTGSLFFVPQIPRILPELRDGFPPSRSPGICPALRSLRTKNDICHMRKS